MGLVDRKLDTSLPRGSQVSTRPESVQPQQCYLTLSSTPIHRSMPLHRLAFQAAHPHQFDQADAVAALLGLDRRLGRAAHAVPEVLVEAQPAAGDRGVSTHPEVVAVLGLMRRGKRGVAFGREQAV